MAEAHGRGHRQGDVHGGLQHGDHRVPAHHRGYIRCARELHPLRFAEGRVAVEEGHRIAAILQVDDAHRAPWRAIGYRRAVLVHETDERTITEFRKPDRRAGIARHGGRAPVLCAEGRATPQRSIQGLLKQFKHFEGTLRIQGTQAESMQVELGALASGQGEPVGIDLAEQGTRGVTARFGVDQQGQRAGKIGVLHRDTGYVTAIQEFQSINACRIDPAGTSWRDDYQRLP